jgi:ferritin-like metal-binding protein YciE
MKQNSLRKLYVDKLKDLYSAENKLVKALAKLEKAATSPDLRVGFEGQIRQTREHVARLAMIFQALAESPRGKRYKVMEDLIREGSEMIAEVPQSQELDMRLISVVQCVKHHEMAGYGCVRTYARLLGDDEAASLLEQTLNEEKENGRRTY